MHERIVYVDDVAYHADDDGELLLDEHDEPIPSYVCICSAFGPHECVCGAWDRPIPGTTW